MGQFTSPAELELLDDYKWRLLEPFEYYTEDVGLGREAFYHGYKRGGRVTGGLVEGLCLTYYVCVPAGYITDLASVPRVLWNVFPPHGKYAKAAIVHDYLYSNAIGSKLWADKVFLEAMAVLGVPRWRRWIMYFAVRLFGKGNY